MTQQTAVRYDSRRARVLRTIARVTFYALTIGYAAVACFPFLWSFYSSLRTAAEVNNTTLSFSNLGFFNYAAIADKLPIMRYYLNSIVVAVLVCAGNVVVNAMAGYALARIEFPGRNLIFMVILGIMMIPGQVLMVPVFIRLVNLNWINTYVGLSVPFLFSSFYIFMMRQFFLGLPKELEEAAFLDGLSRPGLFLRIALPLTKPALITMVIGTLIGNWNSFMWPSLIATTREWFTMPVGLSALESAYFSFQNEVMAGAMLLSIPTILIFLLLQRFIVGNVASSAVKG